MRRGAIILVVGLFGAVLAYCAVYLYSTSRQRQLLDAPAPELAWLKTEFKLSDAEYQRITELHEGYLPSCEEMCRRIGQKNAEIKKLIDANAATPALEQKLAEAAQLRLQCQTNMLQHFVAVSKQMPEEQGRRYLTWIQERTLFDSGGMMAQHGQSTRATPESKPQHSH
jgi:hypothetical protein